LFFIFLSGWTLTTYFVKKDSKKLIREELKNLFDISKKFFISLKNLIEILLMTSFSSESSTTNSTDSNVIQEDEKSLNLVEPIKEFEVRSSEVCIKNDDDDSALSEFSPEVIEIINEEEEKVA
tara:strand:+ start:116 stop:484 length:369 start_codon:yes stop_codon:yes gene_type:complete